MTTPIPDGAVEAAARERYYAMWGRLVAWEAIDPDRQEIHRRETLRILTAAAPHIRAQAAEEIATRLTADADDEAARPWRDDTSRTIEKWLREAATIARDAEPTTAGEVARIIAAITDPERYLRKAAQAAAGAPTTLTRSGWEAEA
jgi:hypothetical protein